MGGEFMRFVMYCSIMNNVEKEERVQPLLWNGILKEAKEEEGSTNPSPKRVLWGDSTSQRVI